MKLESVVYTRKVPREQYGSEEVTITAALEAGDEIQTALYSLKTQVYVFLGLISTPQAAEVKEQEPKKLTEKVEAIKKEKEEVKQEEVAVEKPKISEKKKKTAKADNKVGIPYDIENQTHKSQVSEILTKMYPDWRKTPERAKAASRSLAGAAFLDEEGLVLQSFKDSLAEKYDAWKG